MSDASMTDAPGPVPPRRTRWSGRGTAAVVLTLTALVGILLGVAVDRHVLLPRHGVHGDHGWHRPPFGGFAGGRHDPSAPAVHRASARLARALDLTDVQRAQVDSIMARRMTALRDVRRETEGRVRTMLEETRQDIDRVLTPAQRERFQKMHQRWGGAPPPEGPIPPPPAGPAPAPGAGTGRVNGPGAD